MFGFKLEPQEDTGPEKKEPQREEKKEEKKEDENSVLVSQGETVKSEVKPETGKRKNRKKK